MDPKEQVKTIMDIFFGLKHEDQVSLFQEVKARLLDNRSELIENHHKDATNANDNIDRLRAGNEVIHGASAQVSKVSY